MIMSQSSDKKNFLKQYQLLGMLPINVHAATFTTGKNCVPGLF